VAGKKNLAVLPSTTEILNTPELQRLQEVVSPKFVLFRVQRQIHHARQELLRSGANKTVSRTQLLERVVRAAAADIEGFLQPSLRRVINATGIILHTGLGRAPLARAAKENLARVIEGYCNLELDLASGKRGRREQHVEEQLCFLTGAEAACVVNNNAAAVFLALNTLSFGKDAIVSRGQLIEIGGSFRIPEVMEKSGAHMVEVGTTNKTHLKDYEHALTDQTGVICVVHPSNYRIKGFVTETSLADLVILAHEHEVPVVQDLGGGVLMNLQDFGLPYEPVPRESIAAGVDVVTFSGDKVLGGPQCGILVGNAEYIDSIKTNPLMRVLRCDKLTFALLEPTLRQYLYADELPHENRVLAMLLEPLTSLQKRAQTFVQKLPAKLARRYAVTAEKTVVQIGSGAMPLEEIDSWAVTIRPQSEPCDDLAEKFRCADPAVIGYIRDEKLHFDFRTILPEEELLLRKTVEAVLI